MSDPALLPEADVVALLTAIRDALHVPGAELDSEEQENRLRYERALSVRSTLGAILEYRGLGLRWEDLSWAAEEIQKDTAAAPVTYRMFQSRPRVTR